MARASKVSPTGRQKLKLTAHDVTSDPNDQFQLTDTVVNAYRSELKSIYVIILIFIVVI